MARGPGGARGWLRPAAGGGRTALEVRVGQLVELLADDPVTRTELPAWCARTSNELAGQGDRSAGWSFLVRRAH
jgi:TusA-related sulfurtransferase